MTINSGLRVITNKIKTVASDIVTIRTGTVVSDYAAMSQTIVTLDNDPDQTQVQAQSLWQALPAGTRVQMIAFPPRGLVIIGLMAPGPPVSPGITQILADTTFAYPGGQYTFIEIEGCGGGGGGGGSALSTAGNASIGGGGGAAMYSQSKFRVDAIAAWPLTIDIGAAGAAGVGASGGNGVLTKVLDGNGTKIWCAEGGVGGTTIANGNGTNTAAGGRGTSDGLTQFLGQTAYFGGDGQSVMRTDTNLVHAGNAPAIGGHGGASFFGGGGRGGANGNGGSGQIPGAGGGGSASFNTGAAANGGAGGVGMVLIALL